MRFLNVFKAMFVIAFAVLLVSCAKTDKEKIISFNEDVVVWLTSNNFTNEMKAKVKTPEQMTNFLNDNVTRIAKENGFKDAKETEVAFQKFSKDPDIKKLLTETEGRVKSRMAEMQQYQLELIKQQHPEMLQQAPEGMMPQEAPNQATEVK